MIRQTADGPVASVSLVRAAYRVHFDVRRGDILPIGGKLHYVEHIYPKTRSREGYLGFGELPKTTPPLPVQPISFVMPLGSRGMVNADVYQYQLTSIEAAKKADADRAEPTATLDAWPKKWGRREHALSKDPDALTTTRIVKGDVLHVSNCKYDVLNVVAPDAQTGVKGWVELGFRKFVELGRE